MKKIFCDRCGKETANITTTKKPITVSEYGSLICESVDLCNDCNRFVNKSVAEFNQAMSNIRISFYETLIPKRSDNNG